MSPRRSNKRSRARPQGASASKQAEPHPLSHMVRGVADPPDLPIQAVITKRIRAVPDAMVGSTWTPNGIAGYFPSGAIDWQRFRIRSIEMWGPDVPIAVLGSPQVQTAAIALDLTATVGPASNYVTLGDARVFQDEGTVGGVRSHIKVVPSQEYTMHWWNVNDAVSVCANSSTQPLYPVAGTNYIIDFIVDAVTTI